MRFVLLVLSFGGVLSLATYALLRSTSGPRLESKRKLKKRNDQLESALRRIEQMSFDDRIVNGMSPLNETILMELREVRPLSLE